MDENQIGRNINTTPVQRCVRDGPPHTLVGKAMPLQLNGPGFKPSGGSRHDYRQDQGRHGIFLVFAFFVFFFFDFVPFVGDPRESRGDVAFPPTCGPQKSGLWQPILILSPLLGTPENAGVM